MVFKKQMVMGGWRMVWHLWSFLQDPGKLTLHRASIQTWGEMRLFDSISPKTIVPNEYDPPVSLMCCRSIVDLQGCHFQHQEQQLDWDGFIGSPILSHVELSAFNKMVEPEGRARVSQKMLVLSFLVTKGVRDVIGLSRGTAVIWKHRTKFSDGVKLGVVGRVLSRATKL